MTSAWNKMFGIDPAVTIRKQDREYVHEMLDENPRNRSSHQIRATVRSQLVAFLPMMGVFVAGVVAVYYLRWPIWTMAGFLTAVVVCLAYGNRSIARSHYGPLVRRALRERGYDICVSCGYWLRGLDRGTKCPECGKSHADQLL